MSYVFCYEPILYFGYEPFFMPMAMTYAMYFRYCYVKDFNMPMTMVYAMYFGYSYVKVFNMPMTMSYAMTFKVKVNATF